jgi:hypothetical protein
VLTDEQREQARQSFRAHGYDGPLRIARLTALAGDDERIFVVPGVVLAALPERALTADLQQAFGRKVWIVAEGPAWPETEPLR